MELIALGKTHADEMAALHARTFESPWDAAFLERMMSGPGVVAVGVRAENELAGFVLAYAIADYAEVLTLAVSPDRQRGGLGRALMQAALGMLGALGAHDATLEVAADNVGALALYRALGFSQAGRRPGYYARKAAPAVDALLLSRSLGARDA